MRLVSFFSLLLTLLSSYGYGDTQSTAPLGYWVTYSRKDPSSIIEIKQSDAGSLYGVVVAGLYHGEDHPEAICTLCSDETWTGVYGVKKDEPVLGKSVLWDFQHSEDAWRDGKILRIKSGSIYEASFSLSDDDSILDLTVHAGFFKKTLTWSSIDLEQLKKYCRLEEAYHQNGKTFAIECVDSLKKTPQPIESSTDTDTTAQSSAAVNTPSVTNDNNSEAG